MNKGIVDVGVQDPTEVNSPIAWEFDIEAGDRRQAPPDDPVCYFNNMAFEDGTLVKSGTVILRCEGGLWVEAGPSDPENP